MNNKIIVGDNRVRVSRFYPYPREVVFEAWVDPAQISKWWGCRQTHRVTAQSEPREGGSIRYTMHMVHGDVVCVGRYEAFERPRLLVTRCTMGEGTGFQFESTTRVEFAEEGGGTRVELEQVGLPPVPGCDQIVGSGLTDSLEKLAEHLGA